MQTPKTDSKTNTTRTKNYQNKIRKKELEETLKVKIGKKPMKMSQLQAAANLPIRRKLPQQENSQKLS